MYFYTKYSQMILTQSKQKRQEYAAYKESDQEVWSILFRQQALNLMDKASSVYLDCLEQLLPVFNEHSIPKFEELNGVLIQHTGWTIEVVDGLIPVTEFFQLLAQRKFPSSTWLRTKEQLAYLEEPDMFHDIFGHVPQLLDPAYATFMHQFGELGCANLENEAFIKQLQTLYWFTIEFGLVKELDKNKIYGAGILSSFQETNHVMRQSHLYKPFDVRKVINTEYDISDIQTVYFQLENFDQLYKSNLILITFYSSYLLLKGSNEAPNFITLSRRTYAPTNAHK